jgi:hypothetical protein
MASIDKEGVSAYFLFVPPCLVGENCITTTQSRPRLKPGLDDLTQDFVNSPLSFPMPTDKGYDVSPPPLDIASSVLCVHMRS